MFPSKSVKRRALARGSLAAAAAVLLSAASAAAADPTLTLKVSSPYTWTGSSVAVTVTSNTAGNIVLAQLRPYRSPQKSTTCSNYDKYQASVHADWWLGSYVGAAGYDYATQGPLEYTTPGKPLVVRIPAASLQFGGGDLPWAAPRWSDCRLPWQQYTRIGAWWTSTGDVPGPWSGIEKQAALTRIF